VLLALPTVWSVGCDAHLALLELTAHTLVSEPISLSDVLEFGPTVLLSTPSDALRLAQAAVLEQFDLGASPVRLVVVTGEPGGSLDVTRRLLEGCWGAECLDVYALSEVGVVGMGCRWRTDGIHLDEKTFDLEVLEPDTERPAGEGELGELVVTGPSDWDTHVAHLRTGDLVQLRRGTCVCGRTSARAEGGVLGRVDERLVVDGRLILPSSVEQVVRRHPALVDFELRAFTAQQQDDVAVQLEVTEAIATEGDRARVAAEVAEDLRRSLGLRVHCDVVRPGSLSSRHTAGRRARRLSRQ
jgi:phenylacetate-CoA ligase